MLPAKNKLSPKYRTFFLPMTSDKIPTGICNIACAKLYIPKANPILKVVLFVKLVAKVEKAGNIKNNPNILEE